MDVAPYALAAIAAWLLLVTVAWWRGQIQWAVAAVLPAACLSGALAIWVVPALSPEKSTRALWDSYAAERGKGEPLALVGPSQASVFYYSNNAVVRISGGGELRAFLDDPGSRYLIVADSMLDRLQSLPMTRRGQFTTVDRSHPYYTLVRYTPEAPLLLP